MRSPIAVVRFALQRQTALVNSSCVPHKSGMVMLACLAGLAMTSLISAAPKGPAKSTSKPATTATEDLPAEIPAVPYLTLAIARDPSVHAELGLKPKQMEAVNSAIADVDESFWQMRDIPVSKCAEQLDSLLGRLQQGLKKELTAAQL